MAENSKISQIKLPNGSTYDIKDNTSGYTSNTGTITSVKTTAGAHTVIDVSSGAANFNVPTNTSHLTNDSGFLTSSDLASVLTYKGTKASVANLPTTGNVTGDVWHITADGSEYAWDGTIWQELGTAVDLSGYALSSEIPTTAQNATTGITIADHSTTTIYGVTSSTTAVRGVKTGTSSTTTASKASGANGTAPTLGTPISIWGVKSGTSSTTTASKVTVGSHSTDYGVKSAGSGSYTQGSFSGGSFTQGTDSFTANTPTVIDTTKFSGGSYSHSGFNGGSGSFTQGTFTGGSLVVTSHVLSFTPATHGADSHTHTAATYGTDSFTAASLSTGFYTAGTAASFTQGEDDFTPATHGADSHTHTAPTLGSKVPTVSASDVTVPIREDEATSVPNVTSAGSASTWSFTDVTVPIRADADTTVPIKDSGTTVVTSKTHSITDNGHTHALN